MTTEPPRPDESAFVELLREWNGLASRTTVDLAHWPRVFDGMLADELHLRSDGRWTRGRDDFMGVLGIERAEVRHSRLIAWLLDPCGRHGLGSSFLVQLLSKAMSPGEIESIRPALAGASSSCEVPIEGGRLDIVVEAAGLYLVIENKVDAPEADRQCEYYFDTVTRAGRRFVFLTPDSRPLRTEREDLREAFATCLYADLANMLEHALRSGDPNAAGRTVATEYLRTLRKEFR